MGGSSDRALTRLVCGGAVLDHQGPDLRMTLVIAFSTVNDSFIVSDRMVSLSRRNGKFAGEHDSASNKAVVYIADDGVLALGYTGSAYVHGIPTDKFIAECLYDEGIPPDVFMGNRSRQLGGTVSDRLHALRQLCAQDWAGDYVEVLAVGYRDHRRMLRPFSISFTLGEPYVGGIDFSLQLTPERSHIIRSVGASVSQTEAQAALTQSTLAQNLGNPDHVPDFLHRVIKNKSMIDPTVGPDIMSIRVRGRERTVESHFISDVIYTDPDEDILTDLPVAFTPWLLGWQTFIAPSHVASSEPIALRSGEWTCLLHGLPTDPSRGVLISGQRRKPKP
jgi:hypothetical protein